MFGVLLESKAGKQRRTVGATLSIVAHVAIIGAAAVGTMQARPAPIEKPKPVFIQLAPPPKARVVQEPRMAARPNRAPSIPSSIVIKHFDAPLFTPKSLPAIDMSGSVAADSIVVGGGSSSGSDRLGGMYDATPANDNRDWDVHELLMHVLTPMTPRYPAMLRSAGVDGRVLVEFAVDTTGRVDMKSVKILESTHELFTRSVRDALEGFRFRPAEVGGHRIAALAQMPFEFHITP